MTSIRRTGRRGMDPRGLSLWVVVVVFAVFSGACGSGRPSPDRPGGGVEGAGVPREVEEGDSLRTAVAVARGDTAKHPSDPVAWQGLGEACYRAGDLPCAAGALERARDLDPGSASVLASLGLVRLAEGKVDEAERVLARGREIAPRNPSVLNNLGLVRVARREVPAARRLFESALAAEPDHLRALENLASLMLYHEARAKEAKILLERRLRLLEQQGRAVRADDYRDLGLAALFSGDTDAAIGYLEQARAADPSRAELIFHLGMAHLQAEEIERARKLLAEAYRRAPDEALYASIYGRLLARKGRCLQAMQPLQRALKSSPGDAEAWMALGVCRQRNGDNPGAERAFARACALGQADACGPGSAPTGR